MGNTSQEPLSTRAKDTTAYEQVLSPHYSQHGTEHATQLANVTWTLYACIMIVLIQPFQFGWSIPQLNLSTYHDVDDCNRRPVIEGTCVMFPGHTETEWTFVVNAWIVGGMIGSLLCGIPSDMFGSKKVMMVNAMIMIVGATIQAASPSLWVYVVGRFVTGIASGCATAIVGGYISEISPPHLRGVFGSGFQISVVVGILVVTLTFFFWNTSSGWRYVGGFPIVLGALFLLCSSFIVESPTWLLSKGRREEAKGVAAKLYGEENVDAAIIWMEPVGASGIENGTAGANEGSVNDTTINGDAYEQESVWSVKYRRQLIIAIAVASAQQLSGINAVFFYSSSIFKNAGVDDDRIGSVIVDVVNCLPTFLVGMLLARFRKRQLLFGGMISMIISAAGMTIAFITDVQVLSIIFTATYVGGFGVSLGPLIWGITAELFPDSVRATAVSLCIFANWTSNLLVGVCFPYVATAFDDFSFIPFIVTLLLFTVGLWGVLPETSGKTMDEIQEEFRARRRHDAAEAATKAENSSSDDTNSQSVVSA